MASQRGVQMDAVETVGDEFFVLADHQRLRQVLLNLLSNAVKYNRPGGTVTVCSREMPAGSLTAQGEAVRRVRLEVGDTGLGLNNGEIARLFVPFERLGAECRNIEGSGLGLALSKHLTEAMGGRLGVESQPGVGSVFWIELPLAESPLTRLERAGLLPSATPHSR